MESKGGDGNKVAERQIQKNVLPLLHQVGPTNYNVVLLQFDFHNGFLHRALDKLLRGKLIELDSKKMVPLLRQVTVSSMTSSIGRKSPDFHFRLPSVLLYRLCCLTRPSN